MINWYIIDIFIITVCITLISGPTVINNTIIELHWRQTSLVTNWNSCTLIDMCYSICVKGKLIRGHISDLLCFCVPVSFCGIIAWEGLVSNLGTITEF